MKTRPGLFLTAVLGVLITCNFFRQYFLYFRPALKASPDNAYPGAAFLGLRPYLQGVTEAGYYTDQPSRHPKTDILTMYPYERAQYALCPTLLDFYNPFSYPWIVLNCRNKKQEADLIARLNAKIVKQLPNGVKLVRRDTR